MVAFPTFRTRDLACNPGMCPDWESNRRPCGSQAGAQSTQPHQPGLSFDLFMIDILTGAGRYLVPLVCIVPLRIRDVEHLFVLLVAICMSSLEETVQALCPFAMRLFYYFCILSTELRESLMHFGYEPLTGRMACKRGLPFYRAPAHLGDGFLCCAGAFQFDTVPLVCFCFC